MHAAMVLASKRVMIPALAAMKDLLDGFVLLLCDDGEGISVFLCFFYDGL